MFGVYQVEYESGQKAIWQVQPDHDTVLEKRNPACAWLRPLNNPSWEEVKLRLKIGAAVYMSDGPIHLDYLQEIILGRVIGVYTAIPLDVLLKDPGGKLFIT